MDNVLARIDRLLGVQRGRTKELAEYLGYTNANVVSDWRAGRSKSYMKQLPKIAEFLGTTVDYLTGQTDDPHPAEQKEKAPRPDEARLTEGLNDENIKKLYEYAKLLKLGQEQRKV